MGILEDSRVTHYPAEQTTTRPKAAMIICPGGAYREHAEHEGKDYAVWLNGHGVECFVLAYRLGSQGHRYPEPFDDLVHAVKTIRSNAGLWNIDPTRVGVMGSSAGGHLCSLLLTHSDSDSRPNVGVLCYPVISMEQAPHIASLKNLLGDAPTPALVRRVSSEHHVTHTVPPCFVWHTIADQSVSVDHSLLFAQALRRADVPFELHVYQTGGHGLGLRTEHAWAASCIAWLTELQFL